MIIHSLPVKQIDGNSSPKTIEAWDSLKHISLVMALEEEFEIQFTDDEIFYMLDYSLIIDTFKKIMQ